MLDMIPIMTIKVLATDLSKNHAALTVRRKNREQKLKKGKKLTLSSFFVNGEYRTMLIPYTILNFPDLTNLILL